MTVIATCHCGGTRIELPDAPTHATSCTCTFCTKTGGLWAYFQPEVPKIVSDAHRGEYTQSGFNLHYFCKTCGCTTYGLSPDWPSIVRRLTVIAICDNFHGCRFPSVLPRFASG